MKSTLSGFFGRVLVVGFCWMTLACREAPRRNVVFILVDDLGMHDLGATGSRYYETPYIDTLAAQSFIFMQGYSASRVCSPSRASIMTGRFTGRHGITDWIGAETGEAWRTLGRHDKLLPAPYIHQLDSGETTLAEALRSSGYATFFAGKWHLGGEGSYPEDHGFDINAGGWEKGSPIDGYFAPWTNPKLPYHHPGENLTIRLAEETVAFIRAHSNTRFFAFLSFYAVHGPIQTSRGKWSHYRDKAEKMGIADQGFVMERRLPIRLNQDNPVYAGLVESVDDAVGMVLRELRALGLEKNTLVIFTSDNGGVASGDSFSTSNAPLRGGKGYQWEGGIRVPYFIKVPWMQVAGSSSPYPVSGVDFYPTILDLLDVPLPVEQAVDGKSLKPLLQGDSLADRPLFWHYPHYGNQGGEPSSMIRVGNWKLIHYWEDGRDELYDLQSDPGESSNALTQHPDVGQRLRSQLDTWLKGNRALFPSPDNMFDSLKAAERHRNIVDELWPRLETGRREMLSPQYVPNPTWWDSEPRE